jgi:hypothetical protein
MLDGQFKLEFPLGKTLYETPYVLRHARVSPKGDAVAFLQGKSVKVVYQDGHLQTLASVDFPTGLAWAPSGSEVWVTTINPKGSAALWSTSPSARAPRLLYQGMFEMVLEDISADGRVLLDGDDTRWEVAFLPSGSQREVRLSVFDSTLSALSDDGRQVLFTSEEGPVAYLRPTDGSEPLKLGIGQALALSPDEKWALVQTRTKDGTLSLLPIGPGTPRTLPLGGAFATRAQWLRSSAGIVFNGFRPDEVRSELYLVPFDGGTPTLISDGGVIPVFLEVSPNDRWVASLALNEVLTLYPTDGGASLPLPELGKDAVPAGWTPEGELWVHVDALRMLPAHLVRYNVQSHRAVEERLLSLGDPTGVLTLSEVKLTPRGDAIAFGYKRTLGYLFLLDGLDPPRR